MDNIYQWLICSGFLFSNTEQMTPCNKKLLKVNITEGSVETKCHKCGTINEYHRTLGENNEAI